MDWALLIVGLFAVIAFGCLFDSMRRPERWRVENPDRWRGLSPLTALVTTAAIGGAALAGAEGSTLAWIAAAGVALELVLLRLVLLAYSNRIRDQWNR